MKIRAYFEHDVSSRGDLPTCDICRSFIELKTGSDRAHAAILVSVATTIQRARNVPSNSTRYNNIAHLSPCVPFFVHTARI